jgi:hypothetical protein
MTTWLPIVLVVVVTQGAAIALVLRRVGGVMAPGIMRRLQTSTAGTRYSVHLRSLDRPWNPASGNGRLSGAFGPGQATYWLDDDALVHLEWDPTTGLPQRTTGPIPDVAIPGTPTYNKHRRFVRTVIAAVCAYPALAIGGFVAGYVLSSGADSHRSTVGAACAVAAFFAGWLIARVIVVVWRFRVRTSDSHSSGR